jgi:Tfp pilus assembly protein PilF
MEHQLRAAIADFRQGRFAEAAVGFRNVLAVQPERADVLHYLGVIAFYGGRLEEAEGLIRQSIDRNPNDPEAHSNLGAVLKDQEKLEEAELSCRRAIALNPALPGAHTNLGNVLSRRGAFDEALACYQRALAIVPQNPRYHTNLGVCLSDLGRVDEAIACYRRAIEIEPRLPEPHWNLALALLLKGDPRGWGEFEWRWHSPRFTTTRRDFPRPQWRGEPVASRTILLHAEQGLGDTIQFARLVPLVTGRGANVILECQPQLAGLLTGLRGVNRVIPGGQPLPAFDLHCPLGSLPLALRIGLDVIPGEVPYLRPDPQRINQWNARLGESTGLLRVGLAWAGSPTLANDRFRSISLSQLASLANVRGVRFYSFQKGEGTEQAKTPPPGMELIELGPDLHDFSDTAAAMSAMDLVISVDTAVAHLAGALGKPVWLMLPANPDWRWRLHRTDSAWYPSMRLFRQPRLGDWQSVVNEIAKCLESELNCHR